MKNFLILIFLIFFLHINLINSAEAGKASKSNSIIVNIEDVEGKQHNSDTIVIEYDDKDTFGSLRKKIAQMIGIDDESKIRLTPERNLTTLHNNYNLNDARYNTLKPKEFFMNREKMIFATTKIVRA